MANMSAAAQRKVPLQLAKPFKWEAPNHGTINITKALPYYISKRGEYAHRVRNMRVHMRDGTASHTSAGMWCGLTGFVGLKGTLHAEVPKATPICATCEGRAIGAGMDGSHKINGRTVKFSPRP